MLKDGELVGTIETKQTDDEHLMLMMVGRKPSDLFSPRHAEIGAVRLRAEGLQKEATRSKTFPFEVRAGEVLGFAGLVGAGRTEALRLVFGAQIKWTRARFSWMGKRSASALRRMRSGSASAFCRRTKTRRRAFEDADSCNGYAEQPEKLYERYRRIAFRKKKKQAVEETCAALKLKCRSIEQNTSELSGGNQQKVALSKLLLAGSSVLILDEPTRGIDVGAKVEIYQLINQLAEEGKSIILISSEMMELMGLCDRIVVVHDGSVSATLERDEISEENLIKYSMGVVKA